MIYTTFKKSVQYFFLQKATNLSNAELVFIPIYKDYHWSLVIIQNSNKQEPILKYYDPAGHSCKNFEKLIKYLSLCCIQLSSTNIIEEKGPYQSDGMACGVMVCQRALYELFNETFQKQTTNNILNFRYVIMCVILTQGHTAQLKEESGISKAKKRKRKTAPINLSKLSTDSDKSDSSYIVKSAQSLPTASDSSDSDTDYPLTWQDFEKNKENLIRYIKEICLNTEWQREELKRIHGLLFGKQTRKKIGFGLKVLNQKNYTGRLPNPLYKELVKTKTDKSKIYTLPIPFFNCNINPYLQQHFNQFGPNSIKTFIFDILCKESVIFILKFVKSLRSYEEANNICISTEKSRKN